MRHEIEDRRSRLGELAQLPDEVIVKIFALLSVSLKDIRTMSLLSKGMYHMVDFFWQEHLKTHFPHVKQAAQEQNVPVDNFALAKKIYQDEYKELTLPQRDLFIAVKEGNLKFVKKQTLTLNDLLITDSRGRSLITWAINNNNKTLLDLFHQVVRDWYQASRVTRWFSSKKIDVTKRDPMQRTYLHWAVLCRRSTKEINEFIRQGGVVDAQDQFGATPLYIATRINSFEVVVALLENGAQVNPANKTLDELIAPNSKGIFLLSWATQNANQVMLDQFYQIAVITFHAREGDINVQQVDSQNRTLLYWAVHCSQKPAVVKGLMTLNSDVNVAGPNGDTPLHIALKRDKTLVTTLLSSENIQINKKNAEGKPPLLIAAEKEDHETVASLLERDDIDVNRCFEGKTLLYIAVDEGYSWLVELLVAKEKTNIHTRYSMRTPLELAVNKGNLRMVNCLFNRTISEMDSEKLNSLILALFYPAIYKGHLNIIEYLLEKIDLNAKFAARYLNAATSCGHRHIVETLLKKVTDFCFDTNEETALHRAVEARRLDILQLLLNNQTVHNIIDAEAFNKRTPLHLATRNEDPNIVQCLVDKGAAINAQDAFKQTPLYMAAERGNLEMVCYLVANGADMSVCHCTGDAPHHIAAERGHFEIVMHLIESGAEINMPGSHNLRVLHYAIRKKLLDLVKRLVAKGADVNIKGCESPLFVATYIGSLPIIQYLVDSGARVDGITLYRAASAGRLDILQYFLSQGAPINGMVVTGLTDYLVEPPLNGALHKGHEDIAIYLLEQGVNVNSADVRFQPSALYIAAEKGNPQMVRRLLKQGALVVPCQSRKYRTALHIAAAEGHHEVVVVLLEHVPLHEDQVIKVNEVDQYDYTALHYAAKFGHLKIVKALINARADVFVKSYVSPLLLAKSNKHLKVAQVLEIEMNYLKIMQSPFEGEEPECPIQSIDWRSGHQRPAFFKDTATHHLLNTNEAESDYPLFAATKRGEEKQVAALLDREDIDPNKGPYNKPPLYAAVEMGYVSIVRLLTDSKNIDVNRDFVGKTPLHLAVEKELYEIVEILLGKEETDITIGYKGDTPLQFAIDKRNLRMVSCIYERIANVGSISSPSWLIDRAISAEQSDIACYLLDKINIDQSTGIQLLVSAVRYGQIAVVDALLEKGVDASGDFYETTPLHVVGSRSDILMKLLKTGNVNVNARGYFNSTPLHYAGNGEVVQILIQNGATVNIVDKHGKTPLHIAAREGSIDRVQALINAGADLNARADTIGTPLDCAKEKNRTDVVRLLETAHSAQTQFPPQQEEPEHQALSNRPATLWQPLTSPPSEGASLPESAAVPTPSSNNSLDQGDAPKHTH